MIKGSEDLKKKFPTNKISVDDSCVQYIGNDSVDIWVSKGEVSIDLNEEVDDKFISYLFRWVNNIFQDKGSWITRKRTSDFIDKLILKELNLEFQDIEIEDVYIYKLRNLKLVD
ncbi:MAG: hypothetical protein HN576_00225 [Bacteriovoracaceae bacterium]|nr:hypothetical protein [Bacteriovoracaceae bacterium]